MKQSIIKKSVLVGLLALVTQGAWARQSVKPWYVSADVGTFQGTFDQIYNDQTDTIAQNIRQNVQQNSFKGGVAVGYTQNFRGNYFIGGEVSANYAINSANLAEPSSSLSDQIKIQEYADVLIIPGFNIGDIMSAYLKGGASVAIVKDSATAPAGFSPVFATTNSTNTLVGFALGLGLKKTIAEQIAVFTEYQYHYYRRANLPSFQDYAASYSHSAQVYSQAVVVGLSYNFA